MEPNSQQPGQTVAPSNAAPPAAPPGQPAANPPAPDAPQTEAPKVPEVPETASADAAAPATAPVPATADPDAITWTASEFIAHDKSFAWYAALALGTAVFVAAVFLLSRDLISVTFIIIIAVLFGIYAGRKPRQLEYRLDGAGLSIGQKRLGYDEFRSFSVMAEGAFSSIVFMPLKRFAVPTTIYYAPQDEDKIVSLLSDRLPLEERGHDAVDRLMHRIRY